MRGRVRAWWIAVAAGIALVAFVVAVGLRSGTCLDYVDSPGVCTSGPVAGPIGSWVVAAIGVAGVVWAIRRALRRR